MVEVLFNHDFHPKKLSPAHGIQGHASLGLVKVPTVA